MAVVAGCKVGGFGGFEGFEGLNPKNRWPWWLAARLAEREAAERCARQDAGQCDGHGDKAGSTPPVVPGAAPALAKAGVGGFHFPFTGFSLPIKNNSTLSYAKPPSQGGCFLI